MECVNWPEESDTGIKKVAKKVLKRIRGEYDIDRLISKGMQVGERLWIGDACAFDESFCWLIKIGNNVTLSNRVQLTTHDSALYDFIHKTKLGRIVIDDYAFIGERTLILPGVHVGEGAIIAAGSLLTKNVPAGEVWGGFPAVKIMDRFELEEKFNSDRYRTFDKNYSENLASLSIREEILNEIDNKGRCFIV